MNNKTFNKNRVCFILSGCHHCRQVCQFIERVNLKLPVNKRIKIVDCTYYQKYGNTTDQLILLYAKHFDGFPTIFIGNIKINGSNTKIESQQYLEGLLEHEYVIKETQNEKFLNDCSYNKSGLFKRKVICH